MLCSAQDETRRSRDRGDSSEGLQRVRRYTLNLAVALDLHSPKYNNDRCAITRFFISIMDDPESFRIVNDSITDSLIEAFQLPTPDNFRYITDASFVTLAQAASLLDTRTHKFNYFAHGKLVDIPSSDIDAYINNFRASSDTTKALALYKSNAKKSSPRALVADLLCSNRIIPSDFPPLTKSKNHLNPYLELWSLACQQLGFIGPLAGPPKDVGSGEGTGYADPNVSKLSHPLLPVLMHHFGCGVPTYEALQVIEHVTGPSRKVIDLGSGNGYWTWLLTRFGIDVVSIDDGSSVWRSTWAEPTVRGNGITWLTQNKKQCQNMVLLMVYPITGGNGFTGKAIHQFSGNTIVYVGTVNGNRYTGFTDMTCQRYMEKLGGWELQVQIAMPSFPGKDDGLIVFQRSGHKSEWQ